MRDAACPYLLRAMAATFIDQVEGDIAEATTTLEAVQIDEPPPTKPTGLPTPQIQCTEPISNAPSSPTDLRRAMCCIALH